MNCPHISIKTYSEHGEPDISNPHFSAEIDFTNVFNKKFASFSRNFSILVIMRIFHSNFMLLIIIWPQTKSLNRAMEAANQVLSGKHVCCYSIPT